MPLPQAPINTAPGFGERLLQSGTFSQAGNMITQGILQGKAMSDWKRFILSGEEGSRALYNKVVTEMPELRGIIPEPYFNPNKPNEYILLIAKATSDYKQRKGMATGIRDYKTAMQNRGALQAQPAQLEQGGTMPQGNAGPQQPAQRNFLQSVPQQDIGATAELLASGAESGNLRDMLEVTKELTSALSESAKAQTETMKTLTGAVTNAAGETPYRPSFGDVNMENIMAGKFGFTEERQLKPQLVQRPTGSSGEDEVLKLLNTIRGSADQLAGATNLRTPDIRKAISAELSGVDPKQTQKTFGVAEASLIGTIRTSAKRIAMLTGRNVDEVLEDFFGPPEQTKPTPPPQGFAR